ncbi:MAG: hypothetical protein ACT4OF_08745 [Caulobacteraceae bacterium]
MSKIIPIAIAAAAIGVGLSVLIPLWRGGPQTTEQARIESAAQIEAARNEVEHGPPAPAQQGVLFDLRAAGKIAAEVTGSNIERVSLNVLNLTDEPIRVHIPAGTFFAANNAGAQSMVATNGRYIDLGGRQAGSAMIDTACANLPLDIPNGSNSFTIAQAPPQPDLARIAPLLVNESYDVRQAAVWIITDNADFNDLGILVSSSGYSDFGGMRVIDEHDAARAMQLLDTAGVNVRNRRIWRDRGTIVEYLPEGEVRTWLSSQ